MCPDAFPLGIMRVFFELESPLVASSVRPHFLYSPERWTVTESLRTARHIGGLAAGRLLRLVDSHHNLLSHVATIDYNGDGTPESITRLTQSFDRHDNLYALERD